MKNFIETLKANKIKTAIILVLLLAVVLGLTYALFFSEASGNTNQVTYGKLNITYTDGETINFSNSLPMSEEDVDVYATRKKFSVTNVNSSDNLDGFLEIYLDSISIGSALKNSNFRWVLYQGDNILSKGTFGDIGDNTSIKLKNNISLKVGETKDFSIAFWILDDGSNQNAMLNQTLSAKVKVNILDKFISKDGSGANEPVLASGMIPVTYNDTDDVWVVADTSTKWYNYNNQEWANAVTVSDASLRSATPGTTLPMEKINTMWVWIPRYKYKITSNLGSSSNVTNPPQIDVVFEPSTNTTGTALASCSITSTNCYYTHPAFRDGSSVYKTTAYDQGGWDKELEGIWVGKFETSIDSSVTTDNSSKCYTTKNKTNCNTSNLTPIIKPDVESLNYQSVSNQFLTSLKFANGTMNTSTGAVTFSTNSNNIYGLNTKSNTTDTHMMKNTEWGAVAYLAQSKYGKMGNPNYEGVNKEVYKNNSYSNSGYKIYTGRSSGVPPASGYSAYGTYSYNDKTCNTTTSACTGTEVANAGTGASTTGTIYGIYDMSGGADEYVMGNWAGTAGSSGFSVFPTAKYYEKYTGTSSSTITSEKSIKGDATYETMKWYSDSANFVYANRPWAARGGNYYSTSNAGVFSSYGHFGNAGINYSFRSALIP